MTGHILSESAFADLSEIWDYSVAVWGVAQADRYLRQVSAAFDRIVAHPDAGNDRSLLMTGMRSVSVGRHVIFYTQFGTDTVVLRVVHERRNLGALIFERSIVD